MKCSPSLSDAKQIAATGKYSVLPVSLELLSDFTTPIETMRILKNVSTHCCMLESAQANETMLGSGKTQREVAEYFGFRDKYVVKSLVKRERAKQRKREAGITIRPKGRPRKAASPRDIVAEQAYEIRRLRMENELLRDFLRSTGRK